MRTLPTIDYSEAKRAVDLIVENALQMQKAVVVAVADCRGELIAFARMDAAPVSSVVIAMNKAWTAARAGKPTQERSAKQSETRKKGTILPTTAIQNLSAGAAAFQSAKMAMWRVRLRSVACPPGKMPVWRSWALIGSCKGDPCVVSRSELTGH